MQYDCQYSTMQEPLADSEFQLFKLPICLLLTIKQLRGRFKILTTLRMLSGFGWDAVEFRVTATDAVWDAYLKVEMTVSFMINIINKFYRLILKPYGFEAMGSLFMMISPISATAILPLVKMWLLQELLLLIMRLLQYLI